MSIQQVDLRIRNSNYCGVRECITFVNDFTQNIIQVKPDIKHLFFYLNWFTLSYKEPDYKETICLQETKVMP